MWDNENDVTFSQLCTKLKFVIFCCLFAYWNCKRAKSFSSYSLHLYPIFILNASFIYFRGADLGWVEALLVYYLEMVAQPLLSLCKRILYLGNTWRQSRALLGGGGRLNAPPPRFIEDSENTAARSAAGFSPTWPPCFPQLLWKFRHKVVQGHKVMQGQVTSPGQVTKLQNKFPIALRLQCFWERYETFGI